MSVIKINKKDLQMNNLIMETNKFLKDSSLRVQNGIDAALASSQLEGINISREFAHEASLRIEKEIKKFLG